LDSLQFHVYESCNLLALKQVSLEEFMYV
jgi:hypothetical protein